MNDQLKRAVDGVNRAFAVADAVMRARADGCICPYFRDTGDFRIADLTCVIHGVDGTDPGDGYWVPTTEESAGAPV